MAHIAIIQCVSGKKDEKLPARELYDTDFFDKMRSYAESAADRYWILSAEHGLIEPDDEIEPYDTDARELSDDEKAKLQNQIGAKLHQDDGVFWNGRLEIVVSEPYRELLERAFGATAPLTPSRMPDNCQIAYPCEGMGIGEKKAWLKEAAQQDYQNIGSAKFCWDDHEMVEIEDGGACRFCDRRVMEIPEMEYEEEQGPQQATLTDGGRGGVDG